MILSHTISHTRHLENRYRCLF